MEYAYARCMGCVWYAMQRTILCAASVVVSGYIRRSATIGAGTVQYQLYIQADYTYLVFDNTAAKIKLD